MKLKCTNCNKVTTFNKLPGRQACKTDKFTIVGEAYKCSKCGEIQIYCKKVNYN